MPHTLHAASFQVPFRISTADDGLFAALPACLPHASATTAPDAAAEVFELRTAPYRCYQNAALTLTTDHLPTLLQHLTRDLMVHVANHAPDRIFLHAGVVAAGQQAIVLPGPSFAGKTTLVDALVRAGATYYSDEYAVLDDQGLIHPYTRDLQMRHPGSPDQTSTPAHGPTGKLPIRAAQVLFLTYTPGSVWSPRPVSPGMAVLEMLRHTIPVQRTPARVMAALAAMLTGAAIFTSPRDQAAPTAEAILASLAIPQ